MQVDGSDKAEAKTGGADVEKDSTADGGKEGSEEGNAEGQAEGQKAKGAKEPEPSSHSLDNPARVVPAQEKLVKFPEGSRYMPIRSGRTAGILLLKDSTPGIHSFPPAWNDSDCRPCLLFLSRRVLTLCCPTPLAAVCFPALPCHHGSSASKPCCTSAALLVATVSQHWC